MHLYFVAPAGAKLRNTAGTLGLKIDTRAGGGYVVGSGSAVGGKAYTVVIDAEVAPLPEWLTKLLTPAPLPPRSRVTIPLTGDERRDAYLTATVDCDPPASPAPVRATATPPSTRRR